MRHSPLASITIAAVVIANSTGIAHAQKGQPSPTAADIVQGMSRAGLERLTRAMKQEIGKGTFPGAVTLVARRGEIVHFEAHGFQDAAKTKPMAKESIFRMASMTKPIVTAVAMMLVEEGALKLNDPIAQYLPELKDLKVEVVRKNADGTSVTEDVALVRAPTIQDLMRHTSGFYYDFSAPSIRLKEAYVKGNIQAWEDIAADEMLKRLGQIPLLHQPGTHFVYSISTDVLGLLLERVTKTSLDVLLQERLLGPLGMKDTAFWVPTDKAARLVEVADGEPLKKLSLRYCVGEEAIKKSYLQGGAGLCSTTEDYFKFLQMIINGGEYKGRRYLSRKTVEYMLQDHLGNMGGSTAFATGPGYSFGLGFAVRQQDGLGWSPGSKGDANWAGIFGTSFSIDPKEQLIMIILNTGAKARIQTRFLLKNVVYGALVE